MEIEVKVWFCLCVSFRCILLLSSYSCGKLLFSNLTAIMEYDVGTHNVAVLLEHGTNAVFALEYDYKNRYVYFPRYDIHDIVRFSYPSSSRTLQIVVQTENLPVGITVDSANDHIYWINQFGNTLSRCNLNGTNVTVFRTLSEPWVIRLDVSKRWMYIVEENLGISKSKFDLGENRTIVNFVSTPVRCMHIDYDENRLYWINYNGDMKSAKDDGSDVQTIISTNVRRYYYAIGVFDSYIYYTINNQLFMVTKTPGFTPTVLYNGTSLITSIFVFNQSGRYITIIVWMPTTIYRNKLKNSHAEENRKTRYGYDGDAGNGDMMLETLENQVPEINDIMSTNEIKREGQLEDLESNARILSEKRTVEFECLELAVKSRMKAREESLKVNYIVGGTIVAVIVLIISFYVFHRSGLLSYI